MPMNDTEVPNGEQLVNPLTQVPLTNEELAQVAELSRHLYLEERKMESLEAELERVKERVTQLRDVQLPNAMESLGMESLKLSNGYSIKIQPFFTGSIPPNEGKTADPVRREKCFTWLRTHGFGALIKTEVKVSAGQGDEKLLAKVTKVLEKAGIPFFQADNVHHMTLKSFIREQCEAAHPPPVELFNTFQGKRAKIEAPKS